MKVKRISIADFIEDDGFYEPIDLVLTIKSFDLDAIRQRYIESRKKNTCGKTGSVERRDVSVGGVARVTLEGGTLRDARVVARMPEPRGICSNGRDLVVSTENTVLVVGDDRVRAIENPWFSYLHTVDSSPNGSGLLVSSSGLDCLFEYDTRTLRKTFEWFAWENGFDIATDPTGGEPIHLTRDAERARQLAEDEARVRLIDDPAAQILPTAMRAAFINSVTYDRTNSSSILATMFHQGAVFRIDRTTGVATKVLDGLQNPHGGRNYGNLFLAASTGSGEIVVGDLDYQLRYGVADLPGKPEALRRLEWVQNVVPVGGLIVAIDSNRCSFVVFDPAERVYGCVPYDTDWAIQDMVSASLDEEQELLLESVSMATALV